MAKLAKLNHVDLFSLEPIDDKYRPLRLNSHFKFSEGQYEYYEIQ